MRNENKPKGWNENKTNDSWAIFKIMGEFVSGFEKLSRIGPCVSIFGSARTKPDEKYYKLSVAIADPDQLVFLGQVKYLQKKLALKI